MMAPAGPVLTRRQALRAVAITAGVAVMAPNLITTANAGAVVHQTATPILLHDLPLMYGTPTDLARTRAAEAETVWTLDSEGVVRSYVRGGDYWTIAAHQDWATVLTFGTVRLARWGRPSGPNHLVLVFGTAPKPPPTTPPDPTTDPTAPTDPTTGSDPTTPTDTTSSTGTSIPTTSSMPSSASTVAPTMGTTSPRQVGAPPGGSKTGGSADGELSYTGMNLGRLGLIAGGLLAAGGALLAVRRRRMAPDPDPSLGATPGPGTQSPPGGPAPSPPGRDT